MELSEKAFGSAYLTSHHAVRRLVETTKRLDKLLEQRSLQIRRSRSRAQGYINRLQRLAQDYNFQVPPLTEPPADVPAVFKECEADRLSPEESRLLHREHQRELIANSANEGDE